MAETADTVPLDRLAGRTAYAARQGARVAWYAGNAYLMRRLRKLAGRSETPRTDLPLPRDGMLRNDLRNLFLRDLANVEAGIYPLPRDHDGSMLTRLLRAGEFFRDLPRVHARREERRHSEVLTDDTRGRRPRYYLQNFHYQSGGWMSEESARLYDMQVEVMFNGTANVMRRQVLVPLADYVRGRDQRTLRLLDIGCGTGRFLRAASEAFPRMRLAGIDLSDAYIAEARRHLRDRPKVSLSVAMAEQLPLPGSSVDCVTATFLFHELPPKIRGAVAKEIARVLKPGGRFFLLDTLQMGDVPDYDGLLDLFPQSFHEPYYAGYVREDLARRFGAHGLTHTVSEQAFLSKTSVFEKAA